MLSSHARIRATVVALVALILTASPSTSIAEGNSVRLVPLTGIINPASASFIDRAIGEAEAANANAVVLQIDTPGGLDTSMRSIIQRIIASRVPVIAYVAPPGARSGSAGVYITYSAHVAAMAPGTNIGSAHPVAMGQGGEQQMSDTMQEKVTNDAVAYIKSLANTRGRNEEWAEKAVRESVNITAQDAQKLNVINLVADDLPTLLDKVDGMEVQLPDGKAPLRTRGVPTERLEMSPIENFLHAISDPTIAYILLSLGTLGLIFELTSPGAILPGVVGGLSLLFALFGLGTLPINLAGVLLFAFGFLLFVADVFAPTHGILTAGGAVAFVLGSLMLINTNNAPFLAISTSAIATVSLALTGFFAFVVSAVVRSRRRPATSGIASMVGQVGRARTDLSPGGMVYLEGALWKALCDAGTVAEGELVEVVGSNGLTLLVRPKAAEKPAS